MLHNTHKFTLTPYKAVEVNVCLELKFHRPARRHCASGALLPGCGSMARTARGAPHCDPEGPTAYAPSSAGR